MLSQSIIRLAKPNSLPFQLTVGAAFGLIFGIACLRFSIYLIFGTLAVALFAYASLKRPEIALVGILIVTSSIVFEKQLPLVPMGGISLLIPDFLLLGLLALIVVRWLVKPEFKIVRTPLDRPLLIFYSVTLLSTFIAMSQSSVDVVDARRAIRVLSYYLTFFIVTNLVRELRQLTFLLNSFFLLATIVAAAMIVQFFLGRTVQLLPGRVESLGTQGTVYEDVTRILPPGLSIVLVSFCVLLCILVLEKNKSLKMLKILQCGFLGIAVLLTFLRSYWAALIFVFSLLGLILKKHDRRRFIRLGLMATFSAAMILLVIYIDPGSRMATLAGASLERLDTLGRSGTFQGADSSLNWRKIENRYAVSAIASHPLIGFGMGARYRPRDSRLDSRGAGGPNTNLDFTKFIHNGHLWILLQSGLIGYLSLMWLSLVFLIRGFKHWRSIANDQMRGVVLGFTLVYLAVLIAATVNSTFTAWYWTPVIGIIMGVNEVILMKFSKKEPVV